jgi:hypothetical protein
MLGTSATQTILRYRVLSALSRQVPGNLSSVRSEAIGVYTSVLVSMSNFLMTLPMYVVPLAKATYVNSYRGGPLLCTNPPTSWLNSSALATSSGLFC